MTAVEIADEIGADALACEILGARLERFRDRRRDTDGTPSDAAVHQLRVAARRLQAALRVCAPLCDFPAQITAAPLRRVERRFGALRDLDVLLARLAVESIPDPSLGASSLEPLRSSLEAEHSAAERKAATALDRRRLTRLLDALDDWIGQPRFTPAGARPMRLVAPDLLLPTLSGVFLHPGWGAPASPAPDAPEARPLHALRRRLKTLRYAIECLSDWYGEPVGAWLGELHAIQDALGSWHDERLLLARLDGREGLESLRTASLMRAREALRPWPAWRARYLDPEIRSAMRRLLEGLVTEANDRTPAVLQATGSVRAPGYERGP